MAQGDLPHDEDGAVLIHPPVGIVELRGVKPPVREQLVTRVTGPISEEVLAHYKGDVPQILRVRVREPGLYRARGFKMGGEPLDVFCIVWRDQSGDLSNVRIDEGLAKEVASRLRGGDSDPIREAGVNETIIRFEMEIADLEGLGQPNGVFELDQPLGRLPKGSRARCADILAEYRAEIARLGRGMRIDHHALRAEAKKRIIEWDERIGTWEELM